MKIAVVNAWHDDNKGDGGIVEATISLLRQWDPAIEVSIVSTFSVDHPAFSNAYRHLMERYPALRVVPSPLPNHKTAGILGYYGGVLPWVIKIIPELIRIVRGIVGNSAGARAIAEADLIVSKGGQVFYNRTTHPRDLAHLCKHLYPLILARRYAVPYVVLGQSFGPFKGRVGAAIARAVLNNAKVVFAREEISCEVLKGIGVDAAKIAVIPDVAFWLRPESSERIKALLHSIPLTEKHFWAVTVRKWPTGKDPDSKERHARFLKEMAAFISEVLERGLTSRVLLVVHTRGPIEMEDDRLPTTQLFGMLTRWKGSVFLVDEDFTPSELVALYGLAGFVVGTRFHSVVFALAGGTPAMAISYFGPKANGIMAQLDMNELCIDIENFSADDAIKRVEGLSPDPKQELKRKIEAFRTQLRSATERILS